MQTRAKTLIKDVGLLRLQERKQGKFCNASSLCHKNKQQSENMTAIPTYSPVTEVGNLASLDKVYFFTDYFFLGYMQ